MSDAPKGVFSKLNSATSGARSERELPVGEHDLQLYSLATPNGQKITLLLEELEVPYDAHFINIMKEDQFTTGFVAINPNSKIPTLVDKKGPGGAPINVFESGAILLYLSEKFGGRFVPKDPVKRQETLNLLFFQVGAGPYIGQFGHFYKYAPEKIEYGIHRYTQEVQRLLDVVDKLLEGKEYLTGDEYTIADMAWFPWIRCIRTGYDAYDHIGVGNYKNVLAWSERIEARPKTAHALKVNSFELQNYSTPGKV